MKKYRCVYDGDTFIDGIEFDTFDEAKDCSLDILFSWAEEHRENWKDYFAPTDEELDSYNSMICNCAVWVEKYDEVLGGYDEYWYPSGDDLLAIGWEELTLEDIITQRNLVLGVN